MKRSVIAGSRLVGMIAMLNAAAAPAIAQVPTVQREFTIGCESCGDALEFGKIMDVAISARGDFVVVNSDAPLLRLFDAKGKAVWQGGVKGGGPGEYTGISRVVFLPNGGLAILDLNSRRITTLTAVHAVAATSAIESFPTTAASNVSGALLMGAESPSGRSLGLSLWQAGALKKLALPVAANTTAPVSYKNSSVALSSAGVMAIMPSNERYEILRMDSAGVALPPISRNIERPRLTAAELAASKSESKRIMGDMAEMVAAKTGKKPTAPAPVPSSGEPPLKDHAVADGLRYDAQGRLWVFTMRGGEKTTVFDIFAPTGAFIGSVTIPEVASQFSLGGNWLITTSENAAGIHVATKWIVR